MKDNLEAPTIGAVVVDYYTKELTLQLIKDLGKSVDVIVVVDNTGDSDYSSSWQLPRGVRLIANSARGGFGSGVNLGAQSLPGVDVLLILNSDLRLLSGNLHALARRMIEAKLGAIAPLIVDGDGNRQTDAVGVFPSNILNLRRKPANVAPDWITGACILTPFDVYQSVGGFDERYFMYWEDVDYCMKLHELGMKVGVGDDAIVMHASGASEKRCSSRYRHASVSRDLFYRIWRLNRVERVALRTASVAKLRWLLWLEHRMGR